MDDTEFKKMLDERTKTENEMKETLLESKTYTDGKEVTAPNWEKVQEFIDYQNYTLELVKTHQEKKQQEMNDAYFKTVDS